MEEAYLFVYGLLRSDQESGPAVLLKSCAERVGRAVLPGRLYRIDDYPGAVDAAEPGEFVYGELYRLPDPDAIFPGLDAFEECGPDFPEPTEFIRVLRHVQCDGNAFAAWVYLYNRAVEDFERIESGWFAGSG